MKKVLFLMLYVMFIPLNIYAQAANNNSIDPIWIIIITVFSAIYAYQKRKHEGTSFGEGFIKCVLTIIGGFISLFLLLNLGSDGKKEVDEIRKTKIVSNIIGHNYLEFTNNSVIIDIPYPQTGISSTYGMSYPDDFNFNEIEKDIFDELRKTKYIGLIEIKARFISEDKYGYDKKESPIMLGRLDATEIKKYKDYSNYRPQIRNWVTNYLRN